MKNFEHECNGKIAEPPLETQAKCGKCNCTENDVTDAPCECACHND